MLIKMGLINKYMKYNFIISMLPIVYLFIYPWYREIGMYAETIRTCGRQNDPQKMPMT